jgi:hypothetical protein
MTLKRLSGRRIAYDNDGGGGGGTPDDDGSTEQQEGGPHPADVSEEVEKEVRRFMQKNGGGGFSTVHQLLQKTERLAAERDAYKERVPPEDAVVLTGQDAEDYKKYRQFGGPDEVEEGLEELDEYREREQKEKELAALDKAAQIAGFDSDAFREIAAPRDLDVQFRVVGDSEEEKEERPFVVVESGDEKERVPLEKYVQQNMAWAMPSLVNEDDEERDFLPQEGDPDEDDNDTGDELGAGFMKNRYSAAPA